MIGRRSAPSGSSSSMSSPRARTSLEHPATALHSYDVSFFDAHEAEVEEETTKVPRLGDELIMRFQHSPQRAP